MTNDRFTLSTGEEIPILFTTKTGVRNIILRPKVSPKRELHVTLPRWTGESRAMKFIAEKQRWLERIYRKAPEKIKIKPGDTITVFGEEYRLLHTGRGAISCAPGAEDIRPLQIMGSIEFFERRARDKIKEMFLGKVKEILAGVPRELRPSKITVRDTASRWGSCSSTGAISLSYRLAFAPPAVMRYVIMHEIAHRKHMDHSPKFWHQVSELYGPGVERVKTWLAKNGQSLHRYF
ncbi:MAG: M48 family metallopeptidase [Alphaproteobacteria bacterium]|nr:M48 family metallopeptidase [Alphaproteobacteria bacterium]